MKLATRRRLPFYAATAGVAIVVAGLLIREESPAPVRVAYAPVTRGAIEREVLTSGTLEPAKIVNAGTQVSGTIQTLDVDFNSRVKAGQVIARIDPSVYNTRIVEAQAELTLMQAELARGRLTANDARVKLERARALASDGLITQAELDAAELISRQADATVKANDAAVQAAQAALNEAQITRSRTIIRSPIDGVIIDRPVEVGQTLAASFASPTLFTIADLREMRLIAAVDEADVGGVKPGTPVRFEVQSREGEEFAGTVAEVRLQPIDTGGTTATAGTQNAPSLAPATPAATTPGSTGRAGSPTAAAPTAPAGSTTAVAPTAPAAAASTGSAGAVVSYEAVIDVANPNESLAPGTTAVLLLPTAHRANVVRIPNTALAFRPSQQVLDAIGEDAPKLAAASEADDPAAGHVGYVWKYERGRFVPIQVRTGVADDRWTELISGEIDAGDQLVTGATSTR